MGLLPCTFKSTGSTEGVAGSTLSLVLHASHQTLLSPVDSVGDGLVGWHVHGGVRWSFWNSQSRQVDLFVFFITEVSEFVSVHGIVEINISVVFLPVGMSYGFLLGGVVF